VGAGEERFERVGRLQLGVSGADRGARRTFGEGVLDRGDAASRFRAWRLRIASRNSSPPQRTIKS
jgi:hypothetical protein